MKFRIRSFIYFPIGRFSFLPNLFFACLEEDDREPELNFLPKTEILEKAPVLCVILHRKNEEPKYRYFESMESYSLFFMENNINRSCLMSYWETVGNENEENIIDRDVEIIGATQKKKKPRRDRKKSNVKAEQKREDFDKFENNQPASEGSEVETECSISDLKNDQKSKHEQMNSSTKQKRSKQNKDGTSILKEKIKFGDSRIEDCEPMKSNLRNKKRKRDEISKNRIKKKSNQADVEKQMFACDKCYKFYTKVEALRDHKRFAHDKLEKCDHCGFVFTSASQKIVHLKKHENTGYKCKICELIFPNSYQKWVHQTSHKTANYSCEYGCEKIFDKWLKRRSHYQKYHSTKKH
jgi:hypothetical protein